MKKILTVSLFAMMAVSAANADIASTAYVEGQTGTLNDLTTTAKGNLVAAINEVDANIGTVSFEAEGYAKDASNLTDAIKAIDTALKGTSDTLTQDITADINELRGDVSALETSLSATGTTGKAIADNKKAIADMDTAYKAVDTALGNRLTTAEGKITTIEGQQTTQDGKITALETSLSATGTTGKAIADNAAAIDAIKKSAYATSGVTSAVVDQVTTNKNNISAMDTAYKAADTAIKNTIGTVAEGKTVVEMISEAQTNATYDDTAVRGLISDNTNEISAIKESAYATSGVTSAVVDQVTTNKNNISAMDTAYKAADTALGNRLTTAEGKITTIEGQQTTQDGKITALETSLSATGTTGKAIADNAAAIDAIKKSAYATSGVTSAVVDQVTTNKNNISAMDTAYKAADTATLNSAKTFTTEQIEALGKLATIDTACAQGVTDCALVIRSGEIKWEKVSY